MDALSAVAFGVVLAACAGLRAFLPVFSASLAARVMELPLPDYLAWLDRADTLVLFGAATLLEVLGDKVPFVDHLLDSVQVAVKPVLGVVAAIPFLYQLSPEYAAALGIAMGAPLALGVHATKATVRVGSTATTGGLGNPVLSVLEDVAAAGAVVLAFIAPVLALVLTVVLLAWLVRLALRLRRLTRRRDV
ncbi:MAG TPA: DUF4126 domain-containing protein [Longimicrobium sp.]|nr:DUF4126 domain-containing protein [Longimicrobium sp.]